MSPSTYAKAIVSGLATLAGTLALTAGDGVSLGEALSAVAAALISSGLVYQVPNKPADAPQALPDPVTIGSTATSNASAGFTTVVPTVTGMPLGSSVSYAPKSDDEYVPREQHHQNIMTLWNDLDLLYQRVEELEKAEDRRKQRAARKTPKADPGS